MRLNILVLAPLLSAATVTTGCENGSSTLDDDRSTGGASTGVDASASDEPGAEDDGSDDGDTDGSGASPDAKPFDELYEQGIDKYLGVFTPSSSSPILGGAVSHRFAGTDGPLCFTGGEFGMLTRDGTRDQLMIFLQGGGVCGPNACDAVENAPEMIPPIGILNRQDSDNPARDFDVGYLPYCDGSVFAGDRDHDGSDGMPGHRFRGLQNLSASLDVIADTYPAPTKILLAGNSAGGFGVHFALPLVRALYPDVPIELVNDSGMGISSPGAQQQLNDYWNSSRFFPASCADCIDDDGHLTGYHSYQLEQDPNLRMGFISTKQDAVIVDGSMNLDAETFESLLLASVAELETTHPDRFRSMIADGDGHTFILRNFDSIIGGTSVRDWVASLLAMDEDWVSVAD